jgi:hypothetical protein
MRAKGDLVGEAKEGVDVMILSFGYRATGTRSITCFSVFAELRTLVFFLGFITKIANA